MTFVKQLCGRQEYVYWQDSKIIFSVILEQHRADLLDDRKFPCVESNLGTCMHYKNHCVTGWVGDGTPALSK